MNIDSILEMLVKQETEIALRDKYIKILSELTNKNTFTQREIDDVLSRFESFKTDIRDFGEGKFQRARS